MKEYRSGFLSLRTGAKASTKTERNEQRTVGAKSGQRKLNENSNAHTPEEEEKGETANQDAGKKHTDRLHNYVYL